MKIVTGMIIAAMFYMAGFLTHLKYFKLPPETIIKKETVWKDAIIVRPYNELDLVSCKTYLSGYDTGEFHLDIFPIKNDWYKITGQLQGREAEREVQISVGQSGNWKFYVGIGCGLIAAGGLGYLGYRIIK